MSKKTSKIDESEVLDFLDSLPDQKKGSAPDKKDSSSAKDGENADILDFLDELAQESKATNTSFKPAVKKDKKKQAAKQVAEETQQEETQKETQSEDKPGREPPAATSAAAGPAEPAELTEPTSAPGGASQDPSSEEAFDPLSSISGWWGNSGSKQLNSLWGSASHVVGDLQKTAQSTVEDLQKTTQSRVENLQKTAKTTVQDIGQLANDQFKDLKLLDQEDSENLKKLNEGINTKVGGLLSSFVHTINEQIQIESGIGGDAEDDETETIKLYMINDQLKNFSYIDYLLYNKFYKVVNQVEGSIDLELVNSKTFSKLLNFLDLASITNNDNDLKPKQIDFFKGSIFDAEKLSFANIDEGIKSLMEFKKKQEEESQQHAADVETGTTATGPVAAGATKPKGENNNTSHVFISILPVIQESKAVKKYSSSIEQIYKVDDSSNENFQFMFVLKDLEHRFSIVTRSQALPVKWAHWLTTNSIERDTEKESEEDADFEGVEPEEWIKEWFKDALGLSFGVLAQNYIIKRMGF